MPYPKVTKEAAGNNHLVMENETLVFVNAAIDESKVELAKNFIRFATTDESMKQFTMTTNMLRSYKYELSEEEISELSYFGQTYYQYVQSAGVIYPRANNEYYMENTDKNVGFVSAVNGSEYSAPSQAFKDNASLTAEDYFLGLHSK